VPAQELYLEKPGKVEKGDKTRLLKKISKGVKSRLWRKSTRGHQEREERLDRCWPFFYSQHSYSVSDKCEGIKRYVDRM